MREYLNFDFIISSTELIKGFSSNTSISGWLLNIVSSNVVPDLGNPIRNTGESLDIFVDLVFAKKTSLSIFFLYVCM